MSIRLFRRLSLRARFLLGTSVMLTPLVVLAAGSFLALDYAADQIEEVVEEALEEDMPIVHLQKEIQRANMEGHDFLMGKTLIDREEFRNANGRVERNFATLLKDAPFKMDEEHRYLKKAFDVWEVHAKEILDIDTGIFSDQPDKVLYGLMEKFDAGMEQTLFHLERVRSVAREEIDQRATMAYGAKVSMLGVVVAVFLFGFGIAVVGALMLARSVLLPLYDITEGISRMTAGDCSHRVLVSSDDELGELARAFNRMGERLAQSEACINENTMRDGLTGLFTARELNVLLSSEIQRSLRYSRPFSLILFDVDGFADFNASFGREAGDAALKTIAETILREVREVDRVARYGHDEIGIILTEERSGGARVTAQRVIDVVREIPFPVAGGQTRTLTLSAGVVDSTRGYSSEDAILLAAEKAVREARLKGGNTVVAA